MDRSFQLTWDPYNIIPQIVITPAIAQADIAKAVGLFGNQAMVKQRGDECCPGLHYVSLRGLKPDEFAGIDFPCLIKNTELKDANIIMIIGEAPRRGRCGHNSQTPFSLGTPYAIQFADYPDQCWVYKQIFKGLLERYCLYLTDAYKLWTSQSTPFINNNEWKKILKEEIDRVKPAMIVTFGRPAKNMLDQILKAGSNGIEVRNILHPSQRNIGLWKNRLKVCSCDIPIYVLDFILNNKGIVSMY